MDWLDEVRIKLKKRNQVLFAKDMEYLQDLTMLFREQNHKTMVLWALDLAAESVAKLEEKYPDENRPGEAPEAARAWAAGMIKMRPAQRKILDGHAFAKEIGSKEDIALCHAVGQACAIVYRLGVENCQKAVEQRKQEYIRKLFYWNEHVGDYEGKWADFMLK